MPGENAAKPEIEVTAEMMAAGAEFLDNQFCEGLSGERDLLEFKAAAIFRLMATLLPEQHALGLLQDAFDEWLSANYHLVVERLPVDVLDLRSRLNAAFAKACNSSLVTPSAL